MTEQESKWGRRIIGVLLLASSMVVLFGDVHVAIKNTTGLHMINSVVVLVLLFGGLFALMPTFARAFAKELLSLVPALGAVIPGGRRAYDPPPEPGVPLPPSVTGEPPPKPSDVEGA